MTFTAEDFKRFRWNLLALLLCVAVGAASVWLALTREKALQRELRQATTRQGEVQAKLARAKDEEQELLTKIGRFQQLEKRGYFEPEQRLDWVEQINRIKTERRLYEIQYELAPQKPLDAATLPGGAIAGGYEFMTTPMQLRMQLLHEEDLFSLIGDLQRGAKAYLRQRSCVIDRVPRVGERGTNAQLNALCTLDWVTVREKK